MTNKTIITYEHDKIIPCSICLCDNCNDICQCKCNKSHFEELKHLCSANFDYGISYNFKEKCIDIKKYTGLFQLEDGTYIEILPKINRNSAEEGRKIFQNLIYASHNLTREYKQVSDTSINYEKRNILEIIITIFCQDLKIILKKGLKKSYVTQEENLNIFKGKLELTEHLTKNFISKEKFFVEYDEFNDNIAENRILKSACLYLLKETKNNENKNILRKTLIILDNVEECANLDKDINLVQINRLHKYYNRPIKFAEFFLRRKNFVPKRGKTKMPTLLFPLEKMFEDYIENILREKFKKIKHQFSSYYLVKDGDKKIFNTQMDFVVFNDNKTEAIIIDAKWKLLDPDEINYNIQQADLYQLYAYAKLLKQEENLKKVSVVLTYPQYDKFKEPKFFQYFDDVEIIILPIDVLKKDKNEIFITELHKLLI